MQLALKLAYSSNVDEDIINVLDNGTPHLVKLTTNRLTIEKDSKDERNIKSLKNVKMIFKLKTGCLILIGNLGCSFKTPFGGEFFVHKAILDETIVFENVKGEEVTITFSNNPCRIPDIQNYMQQLVSSNSFEYNISQFEEFMEIFEYYKTLSEELNNNATYKIKSISKPYLFIPVDVKKLYGQDGELLQDYINLESLFNDNEILIGYRIEEYVYELMPNDLKEEVKSCIDIKLQLKEGMFRKIQGMIENIYISNSEEINDLNSSKMVCVNVCNLIKTKDEILLTIESDDEIEYSHIHLYDMGQKIKIESIDNSLKLIKQGATGSAIELIEYLIGDTKIPKGTGRMNMTKEKYLKDLNESQKQAFLKAVDGSPVTLIKGPPGTGKTHVINAITQYITKELNEKVIISSQTHVAIDNVLDKLMENYDLIVPNRITNRKNKYSGKEIDSTLYKTWGKKFNQHNENVSDKDLAIMIMQDINRFNGQKRMTFSENMDISDYKVIGATTTTSAIAGKKGIELLKDYNWLIIDEVSKCPITEVLRYLPYIEKIIMVGDDYQLAPLLEFSKDDVKHLKSYDEEKFDLLETTYKKSVFADTIKKAEESNRLVILNENYRSVINVLKAYNIFYDNQLINRREEIKPHKVLFKKELNLLNEKDIFFVEVKGGKEVSDSQSYSRYNVEELIATSRVLEDLILNTLNPANVVVAAIFPYGAQIAKFTKDYKDLINKAKKVFKSFDVDTVDAFQGKEADIVLVNTVVTDPTKRNFLSDFRRINVSMSRAKDKLIIFGNSITLSKIEMQINNGSKRKFFKDIISDIKRFGGIIIYNSEEGINYEIKSKSKIELA